MGDTLVSVRGLAKNYGGRAIVSGVTLDVRRGSLVGLIGANGGGKTTTLRMLAGLLRPDAGEGEVLGAVLPHARPDSGGIGYMGQRLSLYPELTVAENLAFRAALHGLRLKAAETMAEEHGLTAVWKQRFGSLSGGWARRAQFAATLLGDPPLLLLDEPTAGIDLPNCRLLWSRLASEAKAGRGIVISTHDLRDAATCDTVILYDNGRAGAQQPPDMLAAAAGGISLEEAMVAMLHPRADP